MTEEKDEAVERWRVVLISANTVLVAEATSPSYQGIWQRAKDAMYRDDAEVVDLDEEGVRLLQEQGLIPHIHNFDRVLFPSNKLACTICDEIEPE